MRVLVVVRQKVKDLLQMVQDDDRLREERKKAKKNQDKYIGLSGEGGSGGFNRFGYSEYLHCLLLRAVHRIWTVNCVASCPDIILLQSLT